MLADALAAFAGDGDRDGLLEVEREVLAAHVGANLVQHYVTKYYKIEAP